jgi:hypothetical protein
MPEIITKYPDVTTQVLASAGARCGVGEPQKILTRCPRESFCAFPGGEVCVYGLGDVPKMTQVTRQEICERPAQGAGLDVDATLAAPALAVTLVLVAAVRARGARRGG